MTWLSQCYSMVVPFRPWWAVLLFLLGLLPPPPPPPVLQLCLGSLGDCSTALKGRHGLQSHIVQLQAC